VTPSFPFLDGQTIRGRGAGITKLGVSPGSQAVITVMIGNSNVFRDMTIEGVVGATNTSRSITNHVSEDCVYGGPTNIDNIYFGGTGILTDGQFTRDRFNSRWDTINGVSIATFTDCEFHVWGDTNNASLNAVASVRPIYLQSAGATADNLTFINPKIYGSVPYTNTTAQALFVFQSTNATLTVQNGYFWHSTNMPVVTNVGALFNSHINMDYIDVAVDISSNLVSINSVKWKAGICTTNW
jgi:hypothetical protein